MTFISDLSIKQMIGQMVMAQAFGRFTSITSEKFSKLASLVVDHHIENFKLYHGYALGTRMLLENLQKLADKELLIASDLEEGVGQQIVDFPRYPPAVSLGNSGDPILAEEAGYWTARSALRLGINFIFSPVLDIGSPNEYYFQNRSISYDPFVVTNVGNAYLRGVKNAGAISVAKYFPGNGKQVFFKDKSAVVQSSIDELYKRDWIPFLDAISNKVDAMMVSLTAFPNLDSSFWPSVAGVIPAAFSSVITTEILRKDLGFEGVIITDALNLPFLNNFSKREIAMQAVIAGADILVALSGPSDAIEAVKGIEDALESGKITTEQIEHSVRRIIKLREKVARAKKDCILSDTFVSDQEIELIEKIAKESIVILKIDRNGFPLDSTNRIIGIVIGKCETREKLRADPWQPWHSYEEINKLDIQWEFVGSDYENLIERITKKESTNVIIVLLENDYHCINMLNDISHWLFLHKFNVIAIISCKRVIGKIIRDYCNTIVLVPDFYPACRKMALKLIFGLDKPNKNNLLVSG